MIENADGKSPFEKFYNRKPDVSRIVPFGTTAYIEKKFNKNSIERARKVTFIGYPEDTKGWSFIDHKGKVYCTRNARFVYRVFKSKILNCSLPS